MINFRDDAAIARLAKLFTLASGHRAVLIVKT